jgi:hypothetical protein
MGTFETEWVTKHERTFINTEYEKFMHDMINEVTVAGIRGMSVKLNVNCSYQKVKCALVQALRLCTGHTAHKWSRGKALLFHDYCTRRG